MNEVYSVRQRTSATAAPLPLSVSIAEPATTANGNGTNGNSNNKRRTTTRRRLLLLLLPRREFVLIVILVLFLLLNIVFQDEIVWLWKNRYLYVGCPEYSLWLRPHGRRQERVVHLTAKFGYFPDAFEKAVKRHVKKVLRSGVFTDDEIVSYTSFPSYITDNPAWKNHSIFMDNPRHESRRGAGYWFWKPVIIHHQLQTMDDGDFVIYTDADRSDFVSWTALLLETMVERDADLALEQMSFPEREWTKGDIYNQLCPEILPYYDTGPQYSGNFVAIRKNSRTVDFVSDWMEAAKNYHLISDERSNTLKYQGFKQNRHDQSLLSMLIRCSYDEREKQEFEYTCLGDWTTYTFRLHDDK